ncbi:unnamed protein product [Cyprideis torosa]|uniref:Uncharacterized protein n=1 Tax=Cyprideis torosa TaxID=163714 RepID=A0A7R8ZKE9_9CRUS|nr:unnamed protein product [Cyprideis torosa]CAG0890750.1 unnamed protein product [Cyprideis torosa]
MAKGKLKALCGQCNKKCSGEVLRVQDKYFHPGCFQCKVCHRALAQGGFFCHEGQFFCPEDYQRQAGTKCAGCGEFVEGEVVSALGKYFHQRCFVCCRCRQPFPAGEKVNLAGGTDCICMRCISSVARDPSLSPNHRSHSAHPALMTQSNGDARPRCAGCRQALRDRDPSLVALEKQWHVRCFRCEECHAVLHGEYMGKGGKVYCQEDYQRLFGVKCQHCKRVISGRVIQTGLGEGVNLYFHPTCAKCSKCGGIFGDGEDMLMQGTAIWHPRCGPYASNLFDPRDRRGYAGSDYDGISTASETHSVVGRPISPGLFLRDYSNPYISDEMQRFPIYSYLTAEPSQGYLKRPIHPYDKTPKSPQFHRPQSVGSTRSPGTPRSRSRQGHRSAMDTLVDAIRTETPRDQSPGPAVDNSEPILLSRMPAAKPPKENEPAKIERDDFPAPPFPYTDPERRRRWSGKAGVNEAEDDEEDAKENEDPKLIREKDGLSKLQGKGISKVFLKDVIEREKLRARQLANLDPRRASRVPNAKMEPKERLRYAAPQHASPSRVTDHHLPWTEEEEFDRSLSIRSSVGRSLGILPTYHRPPGSARSSGRKSYTMHPQTAHSVPGSARQPDTSLDLSTDVSCEKLDDSMGSIRGVGVPNSETFASSGGGTLPLPVPVVGPGYASQYMRQSLPNMIEDDMVDGTGEPPKIYPAHLLFTTNYRLPVDVNRCHLERHLTDSDFEIIFNMSRLEFYRLPLWRRNDLKKRARLF